MPHDPFERLDEPFQPEEGPEEKAEKLLASILGKIIPLKF